MPFRPCGCYSARLLRHCIVAAILAVSAVGHITHASDVSPTGIVSVVLENDLFYNEDRNYTSGVALAWIPTASPVPGWALRLAKRIPWLPEDGFVRHGYAIGQSVYTPRDTTLVDPPLDDRPYAGWLYGTIGLAVETGLQLDQFALSLGVVGPASLAEESQKFIHRIRNKDQPRGWDTQLGNEPGIVLHYQRTWRQTAARTLGGLEIDMTPHFGGALGNVHTYVNGGLTLRVGNRLDVDFGPLRIQPSIQGSGSFTRMGSLNWYVFAGIEGRAVARNVFLDGNTFRDSREVDREWLVGDLQFGAVLTWRGIRLSYTHVTRTKEFETQHEHDDFGAVSMSVHF